ncbi:MAG: heme o synthase [Deltaproteobacteria bacterium]|nr:heme o synthase [Deltaproteobacteria bacterium]
MFGLVKIFNRYLNLTKPTIVVLVAITGITTMMAEGSIFLEPAKMWMVLLMTVVAAGSANALNQFIDRDIDSIMDRTRKRRPLPLEQVSPRTALLFGIFLALISTFYFWMEVNPLTAIISLSTILFYVFIYTLWLKRRHYYNIVIGGAAGATAPLIASAAATGEISTLAWILFWIIFMWTPPHFWALALAIKDEYEKVKIPMLPNVLGDKRTIIEIYIYTILLLPLTILPFFLGAASIVYVVAATLLWIWYMRESFLRLKEQTRPAYKKLFFVSIFYLFFVFIAIGLDGWLRYAGVIS